MSEPLSIFLLAVFSIHLMVFSGLYYRHKKKHHLLFGLVFVLLVLSYALRLWGTDLTLYGYAVYDCLRLAAWVATAVAVVLLVKEKLKK